MNKTYINIKLEDGAVSPTRGTNNSAGLDLYSRDTVAFDVGETKLIDTGVCVELPEGTFGALYSRSGLSTKKNLWLANGVGVIDSDYRASIKVPLKNVGNTSQIIYKGDRIAQLVVTPYILSDIEIVDSLSDTERGVGGFGSTGN